MNVSLDYRFVKRAIIVHFALLFRLMYCRILLSCYISCADSVMENRKLSVHTASQHNDFQNSENTLLNACILIYYLLFVIQQQVLCSAVILPYHCCT